MDSHFWQFPAITERLAFERHAALPPPAWRAAPLAPVNTYLGLPWASYIDKAKDWAALGRAAGVVEPVLPDAVKQVFTVRMQGYRALAEAWDLTWGEDVAVHTVCQHVFWERLLPLWYALGVSAWARRDVPQNEQRRGVTTSCSAIRCFRFARKARGRTRCGCGSRSRSGRFRW